MLHIFDLSYSWYFMKISRWTCCKTLCIGTLFFCTLVGKEFGEEKMGLKIVDATVASFDGIFNKFKENAPNNQANLILFLADDDPFTSLSWCSDCVRVEPVIYKKLEESGENVALLRAYVGDRPTWENPLHPWRVDSKFQVKDVPTLVRWENDVVVARLEDHEAHIETKIDALLNNSA